MAVCHPFLLIHRLVSLSRDHLLESRLLLLLVIGFLYNLVNQPIVWFPADIIPHEEIVRDISTCTSPAALSRNDVTCPLVNDRVRKTEIVTKYSSEQLNSLSLDSGIATGGSFTPTTCVPLISTSIIIPFRNRSEQLNILLMNLHPFLQQQQIDYQVFVIDQVDGYRFNRGKLMNVGFAESMRIRPNACCFVFHDVDLIPEHGMNVYACSRTGPRHMSASVNTFRYHLLYRELFGGVIAIRKKEFKQVNGFSNMFYGWGGEDDDLSSRIRDHGMKITRWDLTVSRYFMLSHHKEKSAGRSITQIREKSVSHVKVKPENDGLSSLRYKVQSITREPLFTRIAVTL